MNLSFSKICVLSLLMAMASLASGAEYQYAMIKWDGPDKLQMIYPERAEVVRVFKLAKPPPDVTEEEFCLTWGANHLAKEGWEPVNLNSRRILFRRAPRS